MPASNSVDPFDPGALKQNLGRKTARSGLITLGAQTILFVTQFAGTILLARLLNPDDFGLISMVVAVVGFLDTFKDLGLSAATIQQTQISRSQVNVLFWFNVATGIALALLSLAAAPLLAWFYGRDELVGITAAISVGFLFSGLSSQQHALLRRSMQFGRIASIDIAAAVLSTVAGLIAAWAGFGYWSIVVQRVVKAAISCAALWIGTSWRPTSYKWDPTVKPMLRFGGFLAFNNIMNYAARNIDNVAIGWMWGAGPLGIYSRAYNLLLIPMSQVSAPMSNVAMPAFSRLRQDPARFREAYLALMQTAGLLLIPPVAVLMGCADSVVHLLLGQKWGEVATIYRWLGFAALAQPMTVTCGLLFLSQGRSKELSQSTLINSILAVISILVALPYGPAAVAASYAASGLFIRTPILLHFAAKVSNVTARDMYRVIFPQLFLGGLIFAGSWEAASRFLPANHHGQRILVCCTVGVILFASSLAVSRQQRDSLSRIFTLLKKSKNSA